MVRRTPTTIPGTGERRSRGARPIRPAQRSGMLVIPPLWLALASAVVVVAAAAGGWYLATQRTGGNSAGGAIAVLRSSDFHALAFSPDSANVVFFGHHNGILRSDDGGRTWRQLVERRNFDAMSLAVSGASPRQLYMAGHDVLQVSADGGASWQPVRHNLPGTDIHGFAMSPDDPNRLYAFVVGRGLFTSGDGDRSWTKLTDGIPEDVMALAAAGGDPETLYAGSMQSGLGRSTDGGRTWEPATSGLGSRTVAALAVGPTSRRTVYAGVKGGLYKSTDGGTSWTKLPYPGENVAALAISPSNPNVLLAIAVRDEAGLVFRSEDGGATWGASERR